jgi:hypothetical protein
MPAKLNDFRRNFDRIEGLPKDLAERRRDGALIASHHPAREPERGGPFAHASPLQFPSRGSHPGFSLDAVRGQGMIDKEQLYGSQMTTELLGMAVSNAPSAALARYLSGPISRFFGVKTPANRTPCAPNKPNFPGPKSALTLGLLVPYSKNGLRPGQKKQTQSNPILLWKAGTGTFRATVRVVPVPAFPGEYKTNPISQGERSC